MKTRIITSIFIVLAVLFPIALGGWWLEALGVLIVAGGSYEWLHCLPNYRRWGLPITIFVILWILMIPYLYINASKYLFAWLGFGLTLMWVLPIFFQNISLDTTFSIIAWMAICGFAFMCMQILIFVEHRYLWTLVLATYGSDTGAYFFGRFLGKHKMIERISPKKTWEGFFGGWLCGFVLSWLCSLIYGGTLNGMLNFMICLLAPVFAELGDLCFSTFKRNWKKKDFSKLLPGHGGILDRVDSLLMNIILFGILFSIL